MDVSAEYSRHFTSGELVIGAEAEARLRRTLMKRATKDLLVHICEQYRSTHSCIVKVQEHSPTVTEAEILKV
jgi:hypothetical protein